MAAPISVPASSWSIWTDPAFLSALGSAIGGFFAVFVFFVLRTALAKFRARPDLKKTLHCANYLNRGDGHETAGEIQHNCGKTLSAAEAEKAVGVTRELWEYSSEPIPVTGSHGSNVFFGPYMSISEPGLYAAKFYIRAIGFPNRAEISEDYILLELDVSKKLPTFVTTPQGIGTLKFDTQMNREFIRFSQLATGDWATFTLPFYANGLGEWEFRAFALNGKDNRPDNFSFLGKHARLVFDRVELWRQKDSRLPDS